VLWAFCFSLFSDSTIMKTRSFLGIFVLAFIITQSSFGQAISYYPMNSQLSIATNPTRTVWMDFRFQMNSFTSSLNTEPALMVNVINRNNTNVYVGGGVNFGIIAKILFPEDRKLVSGYFGSFGMRTYPFEKIPKVSVNFELSPYVNYNGESGFFRAWLGLGYHFGERKK
jgi:hypothetical protein